MDTSKVISPIISLLSWWLKPIEKFQNKFIAPVYNQSHGCYINLHRMGQHWMSIGCELEVSFEFSNNFCKTPSRIAIRNLNNEKIDNATILLETRGCFDGCWNNILIEKQESLEFINLQSRNSIGWCLSKNLLQIPPLEIWRLENGNVKFSYDDLKVKLLKITRQGIKKDVDIEMDAIWSIGGKLLTDIHRGNWEKRGSDYYHTGLINEAKYNLTMKIYRHFNPPPVYVRMAEYLQIDLPTRVYWNCKEYVTSNFCDLLMQEKIINIIFWYRIIICQYTINDDGYLISPLDKLWIN
jgi:hypothetical protein